MKKSSFLVLVLGTISGMLFSIGMCMALLKEWNSFKSGVVFGLLGVLLGIITILIWRKIENKKPIKLSKKNVTGAVVGIIGVLLLGIGMCFCMVWNKMILGIVIGVIGIALLLCLIPIVKGLKN